MTFPCRCCGHTDARTDTGGLFCHNCLELNPSEQRALQLERQPPESEAVENYERAA